MSLFILIALPLLLRHGYHYWCIRGVQRGHQREGLVSVVVWFFCYLSLMVAMLYRSFQLSPSLSFWGGYLLLWCAAIGRMISIRQLGMAFSEFIRVERDQPLVDTGIYAYVRHPLHYFLLLEMIAMAWLAGFLWGWGVVGVAMITLVFREIQEERALVRAYGDRYRRYRQRALALIDLLPPTWRE